MCGRADAAFSLKGQQTLLDLFGPAPMWELGQAEVRPTDPLAIVTRSGDRYAVQPASWGLNLQGNGKRYATFNARVETLQESRAFGEAFRQNGRGRNATSGRCVVPLAAIYEWPRDEARQKSKVRISRKDGRPLLAAGLWTLQRTDEGKRYNCIIVTRPPVPDLEEVHDRQPALLLTRDLETWLQGDPAQARAVAMTGWPTGILQVQGA